MIEYFHSKWRVSTVLAAFAAFLIADARIDSGYFLRWYEVRSTPESGNALQEFEDPRASEGKAVRMVGSHHIPEGRSEIPLVDLPKGPHRIWIRANWPGACANSVLVQVGDGRLQIVGNDYEFNHWHWIKGPIVDVGDTVPILRIWNYEYNASIDGLAIAGDHAWVPGEEFPEVYRTVSIQPTGRLASIGANLLGKRNLKKSSSFNLSRFEASQIEIDAPISASGDSGVVLVKIDGTKFATLNPGSRSTIVVGMRGKTTLFTEENATVLSSRLALTGMKSELEVSTLGILKAPGRIIFGRLGSPDNFHFSGARGLDSLHERVPVARGLLIYQGKICSWNGFETEAIIDPRGNLECGIALPLRSASSFYAVTIKDDVSRLWRIQNEVQTVLRSVKLPNRNNSNIRLACGVRNDTLHVAIDGEKAFTTIPLEDDLGTAALFFPTGVDAAQKSWLTQIKSLSVRRWDREPDRADFQKGWVFSRPSEIDEFRTDWTISGKLPRFNSVGLVLPIAAQCTLGAKGPMSDFELEISVAGTGRKGSLSVEFISRKLEKTKLIIQDGNASLTSHRTVLFKKTLADPLRTLQFSRRGGSLDVRVNGIRIGGGQANQNSEGLLRMIGSEAEMRHVHLKRS